ncbi:3-deoxy-7-phosphoheptulonate synthase [candidate division WOR-1 bacterium RIFOXYA12_FULL_52_29]|uniref:3-deoxy-7-phosphoheptulonate synthase n=1 Tax=candidate division WOR-1 bacterium RIFOXYC12_FULL_54_18 TaxID=1802584 RepID=A0A1F4T5S1_UNCSA|nr:MAG: 3-deoxy-7-phosphoheptulonate synthase [candidate division WOR-1 bacterium RIFOXYA2_FULL_51_19]OGC17006.1 MAG: 3-deoxy-7-phosphoheptulonate synthase [candidate division WOR-1 bacterium RIFOXYA12_FULL_52_29]OGC25867.1 MAG: 3-deoxy-7-phosphoheptulonate synthase [candidate division WOR-1 bacterium RIFOXYB2_FULL_45_9]OGC27423.1 MAG: 3-deoxy-7-phosphoheptulonate synthase [candidate division WOR-1 bacterium RIFOXYC12_FULL_54_18]OGC29364.1 MAG: 3-deoxy-7-phosphoheptulonate synthase [candidate d
MIIIMNKDATEAQVSAVAEKLKNKGFGVHLSKGTERTVIGAIGDKAAIQLETIQMLPGVSEIVPIRKPYKLVSREFKAEDTIIRIGDKLKIGAGEKIAIMAGPCSVEGKEEIMEVAEAVKRGGAAILRGGAFKPRTSPYSFQGMGEEGLKLLAEARKKTGLPIVTEALDTRDVELVARYADIVQIGARNMQNFSLLKEVGKAGKPVLLKRGAGSTIEELLMSAEYVMSEGNREVMLCERGIRTLETYTRNTLDLAAVPVIKKLSHLPVIVDPSHGTGKRDLVGPMAKAAIAAGADGLIIEVHPHPNEALSDGPQSLTPEMFNSLMPELKAVASAVGRRV